jgi:hypothetical protein
MNHSTATLRPFDLDRAEDYRAWRDAKLHGYPDSLDELVVEIADLRRLSSAERRTISEHVARAGMALYASANPNPAEKDLIRAFGLQFGLRRLDHNLGADEDAITSLTVQEDALHEAYIPYSNRPIAWHTDGYYNTAQQQIRGLLLHCVTPAAQGGANQLLDHEIAYILLRDRDPEFVRALMHPLAMTIPANLVDGRMLRPARSGPVFSVRDDGRLHMRYTDRSRSIEWRDDPTTRRAVAALKEILHSNHGYAFQGTLQAGQGLICNNVLHTRSGFTDGEPPRLLYRARYLDPISLA